ncbi:MAG: hypothetical protein WBA93_26780 [Microcoleaceae cyanobacterium]
MTEIGSRISTTTQKSKVLIGKTLSILSYYKKSLILSATLALLWDRKAVIKKVNLLEKGLTPPTQSANLIAWLNIATGLGLMIGSTKIIAFPTPLLMTGIESNLVIAKRYKKINLLEKGLTPSTQFANLMSRLKITTGLMIGLTKIIAFLPTLTIALATLFMSATA